MILSRFSLDKKRIFDKSVKRKSSIFRKDQSHISRQYKPTCYVDGFEAFSSSNEKEKHFIELHVSSHPHTCELYFVAEAHKYLFDFFLFQDFSRSSAVHKHDFCLADDGKKIVITREFLIRSIERR